jgi:hypothetical protein
LKQHRLALDPHRRLVRLRGSRRPPARPGSILAAAIAILKLANISDLQRRSGFGISERTTTRRVAASEAAPMALMTRLEHAIRQRRHPTSIS